MLRAKPAVFLLSAFALPGVAVSAPFDSGWIKEQVLAKLSDLFGRRIIVDGELDVDLSWSPGVRAERVRVENAAWSKHPYMAEIESLEASVKLGALLKGQLVMPELSLTRPYLLLEVSAQGEPNWRLNSTGDELLPKVEVIGESTLATAVEELRRQGQEQPGSSAGGQAVDEERTLPLIDELRVAGGRIRYLDHQDGTELTASIDTLSGQIDEQQTRLDGRAELAGRPLTLSLEAGSLAALDRPERWLPVSAKLDTPELQLSAAGKMRRPLVPAGVDLELTLSGEGTPAAVRALAGADFSPLPGYRLQARLRHGEADTWSLTGIRGRFGDSELSGSASYDAAGPRPAVAVELHAETLDLAQLSSLFAGPETPAADEGESVVVDVTPLRRLDADIAVTAATLIAPTAAELGEVELRARLQDGLLDVSVLRASLAGGGAVDGGLRLNAAAPALSGRAHLQLRRFELEPWLRQTVPEPLGAGATLEGFAVLRLVETATEDGKTELEELLSRLRPGDSRLRYRAAGGTELSLRTELAEDGRRLQLDADGELLDQPVAVAGELAVGADPITGRLSLSSGAIDLASVAERFGVTAPPGRLAGELSLRLTGLRAAEVDGLALPGLGRIELEPSQLRYRAPSIDTAVDAELSSRVLQDGGRGLALTADGRYRGEAFELDFVGDPPLALRDPDQPYALDLRLSIAGTDVELDGRLFEPLALKGWDLEFAIAGPDPRRLRPVLGFPLPELPPYELRGQLNRDGEAVQLNKFSGRLGDSDINGDIRVELGATPPNVYATLGSRLLDLDDLAGLLGGTPDPDETASERQRREAERAEESPYLLPREPLNLARIGEAMNGVIEYRAGRVDLAKVPLEEVRFTLDVSGKRLKLDPLHFDLGGGSVRSDIVFDTAERPIAGRLEAEIRKVNLRLVLAPFEIADDSLGTVGGRAKLWLYGNTVAELLASADGGLFLLMSGGKLDALLIELAGLDLGETLISLAGEVDTVPIDCSYLDLQAEEGIVRLKTALVDTRDTVFLAGGLVDFNQELVDVVIEPRPKDFSLFTLRAPLHIEGRLSQPSVYPGKEALGRGAAAALLGAVATPAAALLPLLGPGSGEEPVYCEGLIKAIDEAR